jgi:hypothetical protein
MPIADFAMNDATALANEGTPGRNGAAGTILGG